MTSICILQLSIGYAQKIRISGYVLNKKDTEPIEYANILFLKTDSTYVNGTISAQDGSFEISVPKQKYILHVRAMGYNDTFIKCSEEQNINTGNIMLSEGSVSLAEIVVTGAKPIITREADRLIFNVNSINTGAINAMEVLQNMPGLNVTENGINIIGKGEVIVLINDRQVKMSGKDLANLLKTYSANDLDKIEIITTPPAKYDAEGNAGVLNIVLKEARKDFMGGNLSYSHNFSNYNSGAITGSLTYSKDKITAFFNGGGGLGYYGYEEANNKYYPQSTWKSKTDIKNKNNYGNFRTGFDFEFDNRLNIGLSGEYSLSNPDGLSVNQTQIFSLSELVPDSVLRSTNNSDNKWNVAIINLHLDKKIDSSGKIVRFDADYLTYKNVSNETFQSNMFDNQNQIIYNREFGFNNDQNRNIQAFSSSLRFMLPFKAHTIEFGAKGSFSETKSDISYYNHTSLGNQVDDFVYKENIYALYGDFTKKLNKRWTLRSGVRLEYTQTEGLTEVTDKDFKDDYWEVFPTVYVGYKPDSDNSLNMSISSRLSRPRFNMVNPFKLYENQYSVVYGKPDLKPLSLYSANVGYTLKNNLNFSLYYNYIKDQFGQVMNMDAATNRTNIYWDNYLNSHTFGIQNSYFVNQLDWLQTYFQHLLYYTKSISDSPFTLRERSGISYSASLNNTFYFNKAKTFLGKLSGSYKSKESTAGVIRDPYYSLSAGLNYSLLEGNLKFGLNYSNFIVSKYAGTSNSNGMEMKFSNTFSYPAFQVSVSYTFGAKLSTKERSKSIEDIQNRL